MPFQEWEPKMEFQGQALANALDLSSRLAQPKKEQKKSSLFHALCDQNRRNEEEKEKEADDDWRQFLNDPTPYSDPPQPRSKLTTNPSQRDCYSQHWTSNRWSTRTSGCSSLHSSEYQIDFDVMHIDDHSSFDDSNNGFIDDTPEGSITTHPDYLDTYSENGVNSHHRFRMPNRRSYASADTWSDIIPRSIRTTSSLPYNPYSRARVRTSTLHSTPSISCPCPSEPVIPEQPIPSSSSRSKLHEKWHQLTDGDRKRYLEDLIQSLSVNDQLHIIRMIAPAADIQEQPHPVQDTESWNLHAVNLHACDAGKISEVEQYVAQCNTPIIIHMSSTSSTTDPAGTPTNPLHPINAQIPPPPPVMAQLRRSNSDPNLADTTRHLQASQKREDKQKQRHIYRWLNSQKPLIHRRKRKLLQERQLPQLFSQQEVLEVTSDPTIDEQNEEIDVCE